MNNLVSIIIPTFNCAHCIRFALESVLGQTYQSWEVLVIDDGSTDNTEEVVGSITDRRIRYIKMSHQGNYFARNRGLKEAKGEYIAFLDADDIFFPEKLAKQVGKFIQNPRLGFCCTNFYLKFAGQDDRRFIDRSHSFTYEFDTGMGFIERVLDNNFVGTSTVMIRRECIGQIGRLDTKFQNAMDYEYWLRIVFHYPAYYMSERLTQRLEHPLGIGKNKINTYKALLYIFSECGVKFSTGRLYKPEHADLIRRKWQKSQYYLGLEYLKLRNYQEAYRCLKECRYPQRRLFIRIAMFAAQFHLSFLVTWICLYRSKKQQQQIVAV